jgi:hypothetical protein
LIGADAQGDAIAFEVAGEIRAVEFELAQLNLAQVAARVERADFGGEQVEAAEQAGDVDAGGLIEDLARRACLGDFAFAQNDHFLGELEAFIEVVSDQKNRRFEIGADLLEDSVKFRAQRSIEALRRLIEEQNARRSDEGSRDGAALALAAGNFVRAAAGGILKAKALDHIVHAAVTFEARFLLDGELEVLPQGHMGKERVVLKDVAAVARLRGEMNAGCAVEQDLIVEHNAAFVGADESGDGIEGERFAGSAGSEQDGDAGAGLKFEVEGKGRGVDSRGKSFSDAGVDHRAFFIES